MINNIDNISNLSLYPNLSYFLKYKPITNPIKILKKI